MRTVMPPALADAGIVQASVICMKDGYAAEQEGLWLSVNFAGLTNMSSNKEFS